LFDPGGPGEPWRRREMEGEAILGMNGHIERCGASYLVIADGKTVAVRPDAESAEECLIKIYLFRQEKEATQ
jgi:hypothetical protein